MAQTISKWYNDIWFGQASFDIVTVVNYLITYIIWRIMHDLWRSAYALTKQREI